MRQTEQDAEVPCVIRSNPQLADSDGILLAGEIESWSERDRRTNHRRCRNQRGRAVSEGDSTNASGRMLQTISGEASEYTEAGWETATSGNSDPARSGDTNGGEHGIESNL